MIFYVIFGFCLCNINSYLAPSINYSQNYLNVNILCFSFCLGYVLSIMGRRRTLPNISSPDWGIRMQAERQAVNFVVQGRMTDSYGMCNSISLFAGVYDQILIILLLMIME